MAQTIQLNLTDNSVTFGDEIDIVFKLEKLPININTQEFYTAAKSEEFGG